MTDNARYCRYRGCGRTYVRRYVPSYDYYATPYYNDYGPSYSCYGGMARTADTGMAVPGISLGFGFGGFGLGFGGGMSTRQFLKRSL